MLGTDGHTSVSCTMDVTGDSTPLTIKQAQNINYIVKYLMQPPLAKYYYSIDLNQRAMLIYVGLSANVARIDQGFTVHCLLLTVFTI